MVLLAASRLAVASHVCYWLAMTTVQHGWLERPRRLRLQSTQLFNSTGTGIGRTYFTFELISA